MISRSTEGTARVGADANVRSLAQEFWALLNAGSTSAASDIARRLAPPPIGAFVFPEGGEQGPSRGTSMSTEAPLDVGTPGSVAGS